MNITTSECSSGCESGWTMYLDQLSNSTNPYSRTYVQNYEGKGAYVVNEDQEDADLSMVSDASSGPPNLHENYAVDPQYYGYASSVPEDKKKSKQKSKTKEPRVKKQHNLCLDDTASSQMLHFSQDNAVPPEIHNSVEHVHDFSQVFSAEHFEEEPIPKKHFGFFKSSTKGKSGSLLGRKRQ